MAPPARSLKILLAEDNRVNPVVAVRLLEKSAHSVFVAENGRDAVESESGSYRRTPVIALTAHAMAGDEQNCINAGMDGYLSKALDPRLLTDALGRI